ncbi:MAG: hypothetical protein AB7I33_04550 [Gemmatimonadales bacterium]
MRYWKWLTALLLVVAVVLAWRLWKCRPVPPPRVALEECPHGWNDYGEASRRMPSVNGAVNLGNLVVPGRITNIPEFHDCQRFVSRNGAYMGFFAIFAAEDLQLRFDSVSSHKGVDQPQVGWAMGVIWSEEDEYKPLGISKGFNCLFLYYRVEELKARMVPVTEESQCGPAQDPGQLPGTDLSVVQAPTAADIKEVPMVARWDWDDARKEQYIDIACGAAVCQVGSPGFNSAPQGMAVATQAVSGPVVGIKLWYDEQNLANTTTSPPTLSGVHGAAIPDPNLGNLNNPSDFLGQWQPGAEMQFDKPFPEFAAKFGIPPEASRGPFQISMCAGKRGDCNVPQNAVQSTDCIPQPGDLSWWAKLVFPGGSVYRCIKRVDHTLEVANAGISIPGTARWHWVKSDATLWMRCLQGCCELR